MSMAKASEEILKSSPFTGVYAQPEVDIMTYCALGLKYPIDVDAIKSEISTSIIMDHPRFCSLLMEDRRGRHYWKKIPWVNIDDHIKIIRHQNTATTNEENEAAINAYLADMSVASPLGRDRPLWELHILLDLNCVVLRAHHAMGDGFSMMSLLSICFSKKKVGGPDDQPRGSNQVRQGREKGVWGMIKSVLFTVVFMLKYLVRLLWVRDKKTALSGGKGVEFWPRKLVTVKLELEDLKTIKKAIPGATVNDVLMGVVSCSLSKYLNAQSTTALQDNLQITSISLANMRKIQLVQKLDMIEGDNVWSFWGNKTGIYLVPMYYRRGGGHPLQHVTRMKKVMDQKKQSFEPHIPYIAVKLVTYCLGSKAASWLARRIISNTTVLMSNIVGPREEIAIAGNPVTFMRANISGLTQAIAIYLLSYAGRADLQLLVAEDIVRNPEFLADCFRESLGELIDSVSTEVQTQV
ncbi:hypothetical protein Ancab_028251 [Ancistrocladus abbreviatus]